MELTQYLGIDNFKMLLEQRNYDVDPEELKELVKKLSANAKVENSKFILNQLKDNLISQGYAATLQDDDTVLDVSLNYCGLQFTLGSENLKLILIEEMWYHRGLCTEGHFIVVGSPTVKNVVHAIQLFLNQGRGCNGSTKSMFCLLTL